MIEISKFLLPVAAGLLMWGALSGCTDGSSASGGFHHDEANDAYY